MPEIPDHDPVTTKSLGGYYLLAAVLLVASLGWALFDEFFGLRPWKKYQRVFYARYEGYLSRHIPKQKDAEEAIRESAEFLALKQQLEDLKTSSKHEMENIEAQAKLIDQRLADVTSEYTDRRADFTARIYELDHTGSQKAKDRIRNKIEKFKQGPFVFNATNLQTGKLEKVSFSFPQLEQEFNDLQARKARLQAQEAELQRPISELNRKVDAYIREHLNGLTETQLRGLLNKTETSEVEIRQINNPDAGIVDRCESCHLGIREPAVLTRADLGEERVKGKQKKVVLDEYSAAFTSHPDMDLLRIHDPEKFGCTPCHNGNGMQVDSVEEAHGYHEHWLWPLYGRVRDKEGSVVKSYLEAGCQQCHASDMVVAHAPVLSRGKELFYWRGCQGCHRFQGYDPEPEDLVAAQQSIRQLEAKRAQTQRDILQAMKAADEAPDNETARKFNERAEFLRVSISDIDNQVEQFDYRSRNLLRDMKKIGPDLKEVRVKIRPQWVPVWIENPHAWRPTTRMPRFRLAPEEVKNIAAFVWQSGIDAKLPAQPPGDPVRGRDSFETRGCLGCHSVGEGDARIGGTFAANLTRVGEKDNYDYLVRWIHNPRERTRPYCPYEKRDLTETDYKKHGVPFVFDLDHSVCPNDGHELQVEQMTVMPSLRLSVEDARDIASYLLTLKKQDPASYPAASYLDDPKRAAEGKLLAKRNGCAGCHEIAGLEEEGRIGTELTKEGSKPLEQFDFGLFVREARDEGWYSHKGFFEHKLEKPNLFDEGLEKGPNDRLRMPNLDLKPEEITAVTTFLLGSVDSTLPRRYFFLPEDPRKDVQEGWWLVKKYNCMGCHQFMVGQASSLMGVPRYQTPEWKEQLPPKLMGEGARVDPEWLLRFLSNPALNETDTDRNGVRPYLKARMPTFFFSPGEVRKLVRFFQALASQPIPYIPPKLEPLTPQELALARALFTSRAAPCLKCHATGVPSHDRYATAPNFLLAHSRLKPGWTKRWILDPSMISPGTAMPSGLFKRDADRWVFSGPAPPMFQGYSKDHADLLVRYMFEITPAEQQRLIGMTTATSNAPPEPGTKTASLSRAATPGVLMKAH